MSETTSVGQVRQRAKVETDGDGLQHITDSKAEAWTGTEWVDVRALIADAERVRRVEELLRMWDQDGINTRGWLIGDLWAALDGTP